MPVNGILLGVNRSTTSNIALHSTIFAHTTFLCNFVWTNVISLGEKNMAPEQLYHTSGTWITRVLPSRKTVTRFPATKFSGFRWGTFFFFFSGFREGEFAPGTRSVLKIIWINFTWGQTPRSFPLFSVKVGPSLLNHSVRFLIVIWMGNIIHGMPQKLKKMWLIVLWFSRIS